MINYLTYSAIEDIKNQVKTSKKRRIWGISN